MSKDKKEDIDNRLEDLKQMISSRYKPAANMKHPTILKNPEELHRELLMLFPGIKYDSVYLAMTELGFKMNFEHGWMLLEVDQNTDR
jgi:hypothetical protein